MQLPAYLKLILLITRWIPSYEPYYYFMVMELPVQN